MRTLAQARARATTTGQERVADLMEADQLSRTADASNLLSQAQQRLAIGDARGADVRVRAAKLAAGSKPIRGIGEVAARVEARSTIRSRTARRPSTSTAPTASPWPAAPSSARRTRSSPPSWWGTDRAAAKASASAKLREYDLARAKGEPYEDTV